MKIVQSFWSKPLNKLKDFRLDISLTNRKGGGWFNERIYFMSCALSVLKLRQFYDNVELVTDSYGKKFLIDELNLPYTNVRLDLDKIENYTEDIWAIGKLFAYKIQKEPFIHVDNDLFIWKPFDRAVWNARLATQSYEFSLDNYDLFCKDVYKNFTGFTEEIGDYTKYGGRFIPGIEETPYNFGIFGGTDISFIHYYVDFVIDFLDKNIEKVGRLKNPGALSVYLEQGIFFCLSKFRNIPVHLLFKDEKKVFDFKHFTQFENIPEKWFIHALSKGKKIPAINEQVYLNLLNEFPDYHKKICETFTN